MKSSVLILVALLLGGAAATLVWRTQSSSIDGDFSPVIVATVDIPPGRPIREGEVKLVQWPVSASATGSLRSLGSSIGRIPRGFINAGEPVIESRLAPARSAGGLAAIVAPGRRAVSLRADDVVGVAGFITPGSFVDVVASIKNANSETFSRIVLERVKVLAIEQDITGDPAKPKVASAVTLELEPDEVEKLDLARSIGNLSLALRNEFDDLKVKSEGVRIRDIMGDFSIVSGLSPATVQLDSPASGSKVAGKPKVEEIRGVMNGPLR